MPPKKPGLYNIFLHKKIALGAFDRSLASMKKLQGIDSYLKYIAPVLIISIKFLPGRSMYYLKTTYFV